MIDTGQQPLVVCKMTKIGLFAKANGDGIDETLDRATQFLKTKQIDVHTVRASDTATQTTEFQNCKLLIVIGGDGTLLKAARAIVDSQIPIVGINRGNLGFLADVNPNQLEESLEKILAGDYYAEQRTMLQATIVKNQKPVSKHLALNDVVLHHGDIARLIEFEIYIDDLFVIDQRADGLITSTPTGSTAYALSGGGPIVYPTLDVLTLMTMFPHTLSARPIVIHKNSKIKLKISPNNKNVAKISCDGQSHMSLDIGDELHIQAHEHNLQLLHPKEYNYFAVLREKLGWNLNLK